MKSGQIRGFWNLKHPNGNVQRMDSDYTIRTGLTLFRLCNMKSVNHPVESQQMGEK